MRAPAVVYLVASAGALPEAFARLEDAVTYASEHPDSRLTRHPLRQSMDEAVVVFDRRAVVARGETLSDRTSVVRQFVDDPLGAPGPADVEWFHDDADSTWHVVGFGTDRAVLDAEVRRAVEQVSAMVLS